MKNLSIFTLVSLALALSACSSQKKEIHYDMTIEKVDATMSDCRRSCIKQHSGCLSFKETLNKEKMQQGKLSPQELKKKVEEYYRIAKEREKKCDRERSHCLALCLD